jgi:hypothetical protein
MFLCCFGEAHGCLDGDGKRLRLARVAELFKDCLHVFPTNLHLVIGLTFFAAAITEKLHVHNVDGVPMGTVWIGQSSAYFSEL